MQESIVNHPQYAVRYTRLLDKSALINWVSHPDVLKEFPMDNQQEIEIMLRNWIGFSRYQCSLTATYDYKPIGMATLFLMPYQKVVHLAMFNIVVAPHMQRQGVGNSLILHLKQLAKEQFRLTSIHAEMMEDSPLISVLKRNDFYEVFHQEGFFKRGGKMLSRIVMETQLA